MSLKYSGWVLAKCFVYFLAMYLQCTGSGHHPLPPVQFLNESTICTVAESSMPTHDTVSLLALSHHPFPPHPLPFAFFSIFAFTFTPSFLAFVFIVPSFFTFALFFLGFVTFNCSVEQLNAYVSHPAMRYPSRLVHPPSEVDLHWYCYPHSVDFKLSLR